ncbi:MAG: arginase [Anaerolineae bacterium]|nr:arginase [Anaerolineae bacterium]
MSDHPEQLKTARRVVRIVGAPVDLAQSRRGTDMGPSALRYAGLGPRLGRLGYAIHDCGNVRVPVVEEVIEHETRPLGEGNAYHLEAVAHVCGAIYEAAADCIGPDEQAVFLGGDHSISIGTVAAMGARANIGVLWIDAHADFNVPETSPSGNIHGMPVAALLGQGPSALTAIGTRSRLQPGRIAMIGLRDLDLHERARLVQSGIGIFTMTDVDEHGIGDVTRRALTFLGPVDRLHVSLDMDSLDPEIAPGVGTPVSGGLTYREAHLLMEILAATRQVSSLDIVEINPILDVQNRTARMAVDLAASLFGQRIL